MNRDEIVVFNAHSGDSFHISRHYFVTLDELRKWCSSQFNIALAQVFLISPFGIRLKRSTSLEETDEIYVFDRNLFSTENNEETIKKYILSRYTETVDNLIQPITSPLLDINLDRIADTRNSRHLVGLLTTNLGWAAAIQSDSMLFQKKISQFCIKLKVFFKALRVATQYIDSYCLDVRRSYDSLVDFVFSLKKESLSSSWKEHYAKLNDITLVHGDKLPLSSLLDEKSLNQTSKESTAKCENVSHELSKLKSRLEKSTKLRFEVESLLTLLEEETQQIIKKLEPGDDLKEITLLSDKVQSDTKRLLEKTKNSIDTFDVDIIMETFENQKSNLVSPMYNLALSLYESFLNIKELALKTQVNLSNSLRKLSTAQAEMVYLKESLRTLNTTITELRDLESVLAETIDLPLLYGLYIVEQIRRDEWLNQMKCLASTTNEKLASLRDREIKFRTQWVKNFSTILKLLNHDSSSFNNTNVVTFDVNVNGTTKVAERFTKEQAIEYVNSLKLQNVNSQSIDVLMKAIGELPPHLSPLKISLNPEKSEKTESMLKGYKARIKKLESLLYHEQIKNFSQWPGNHESRFPLLPKYPVSQEEQEQSQNTSTSFLSKLDDRSPSPKDAILGADELSKANDKIKALTAKLQKYESSVDIIKEQLKEFKLSLTSKDIETQNLTKELESLKDDHLVEISKLKIKISEQMKYQRMVEQENEIYKIEIQNLENNINENRSVIELLKNDYSDERIKLNQELNEKTIEIDALKSVEKNESELEGLKKQIQQYESEMAVLKQANLNKDYELEKSKETYASLLRESNESKTNDAQRIKTLEEENLSLKESNIELGKELDNVKENHDIINSMKNDLLENMSNRENDFAKEKGIHEHEIESLKMRVEELEKTSEKDKFEHDEFAEFRKKISDLLLQLVIIINSLIIKSKDLSEILFENYEIFCSTLKSVGLLAVKSQGGDTNIIRVKGLRKLNNTTDLTSTIDLANGVATDLEREVSGSLPWAELPDQNIITSLVNTKDDDDDTGKVTENLIEICKFLIKNYDLTEFEEKYLSFVGLVTNLNTLYSVSVSKRFREVEHLAKKELKENRKLLEQDSQKISIRNFKVGDLVLFLPTRSSTPKGSGPEGSPLNWAVFNDMGDIKFLLKNRLMLSLQKQWIVGRVLQIEKSDKNDKEYWITAEETG